MPELPVKEHLPAIGSRGVADAMASRIDEFASMAEAHGFTVAARALDEVAALLGDLAAGRA